MPQPDMSKMDRFRKRTHMTEPFNCQSFFMDRVSSENRSFGILFPKEQTWDSKNLWWEWRRHIRRLEKNPSDANVKYAADLRMLDIGAPFTNVKEYVDMGAKYYDLAHSNGSYARYYGYKGPLVARIITETAARAQPWNTSLVSATEAELDAKGTTAIARCAPTAPHVSAYTSIGEIYREGLPSLPGFRWDRLDSTVKDDVGKIARSPKEAAGEYLNYTFGIQPTVADAKAVVKALQDASSIYAQYRRDAGRLVRRGYSFPVEEKQVSRVVYDNTLPAGGPGSTDAYLWQSYGTTVYTVTEVTKTWFSGAFTYAHLQEDDLLERATSRVREMHHLLGVAPTSESLWNLMPWSWAADWVTNIGDMLRNISMFQSDGLIMRWGYVMETKTRIHEYHHFGSVAKRYGGGTQQVDLRQVFTQEVKRRRPATPFGFGFELDGMTGRRAAIMAALGISQMPMVR